VETAAPSKKWFVVTTYSGFENKVKSALQERIRQYHMEEKFGEILIPSETVTDVTKTASNASRPRPASLATSSSKWR
jgi:transcriptional antiterminator NusG